MNFFGYNLINRHKFVRQSKMCLLKRHPWLKHLWNTSKILSFCIVSQQFVPLKILCASLDPSCPATLSETLLYTTLRYFTLHYTATPYTTLHYTVEQITTIGVQETLSWSCFLPEPQVVSGSSSRPSNWRNHRDTRQGNPSCLLGPRKGFTD